MANRPRRIKAPPGRPERRVKMQKRTPRRPSKTSMAAIAIAMIALIATFGGAAMAGKGKKKPKLVNSVVTQTVNDPGQINDNGNYDNLTATQQCGTGTTAISASAFWGGTALIDPQADQEWIIDIKSAARMATQRAGPRT